MIDTQPPRSRRQPRRISAASLENAALYYLQRFDSTAANLRQVLRRKVRRAALHAEAAVDFGQAELWITAVVEKMQRLGYVDDARTARSKARSLFGRGTAPTMIRRRLSLAGADTPDIDAAIAALQDEAEGHDLTLQAAVTFARRRRLGPFRPDDERPDRRDKDMAAMARAGFDFDTVRQVIDADDTSAWAWL